MYLHWIPYAFFTKKAFLYTTDTIQCPRKLSSAVLAWSGPSSGSCQKVLFFYAYNMHIPVRTRTHSPRLLASYFFRFSQYSNLTTLTTTALLYPRIRRWVDDMTDDLRDNGRRLSILSFCIHPRSVCSTMVAVDVVCGRDGVEQHRIHVHVEFHMNHRSETS